MSREPRPYLRVVRISSTYASQKFRMATVAEQTVPNSVA